MTPEELDRHVAAIFATLDALPPPLVRTLAEGLALAGPPASMLSAPVSAYANNRGGPLAPILMRATLHKLAAEGTLIARLASTETPFWREVEGVLVELAGDALPIR